MTRLQAHRARVVQRHLERSLLARVLGVLTSPARPASASTSVSRPTLFGEADV
jgi:hypothetical protein